MNTETKPLYKILNEARTGGIWETSKFKEGDYSLCEEDAGDMIAEGFTEANAQYTALAVNNLASVADALAELYALAYQWANDKEDETLVKAKEALKRIS